MSGTVCEEDSPTAKRDTTSAATDIVCISSTKVDTAPDVLEPVGAGELEVELDIRSGAGVFIELGADGAEGTKRGSGS